MPDHIDLQNFLPFRLNRVSTILSRRLSQLYSDKYGLDVPQWRVMATLGHRRVCTAQAIVFATYTHKSTISRAVSKLVASGYVESYNSETDKREILLRFTPAGESLYQELVPLIREVEAEVIGKLGGIDYQQLQDALGTLENALGILSVNNELDRYSSKDF